MAGIAEAKDILEERLLEALDYIADGKETAELSLLRNAEMDKIREAYGGQAFFEGSEAEKIKDESRVSVLALPNPEGFREPGQSPGYLGEIYLNWDFAGGNMRRLTHLMIHALLHLKGYLHDDDMKAREMEVREKEIIDTLDF